VIGDRFTQQRVAAASRQDDFRSGADQCGEQPVANFVIAFGRLEGDDALLRHAHDQHVAGFDGLDQDQWSFADAQVA